MKDKIALRELEEKVGDVKRTVANIFDHFTFLFFSYL